jgi:hypothetical protein
MEQERRQCTRIRPTQLVYLELGADNGGMVRDISETGIGFFAMSPLAGGEKIKYIFKPDGVRRLEGKAEVAWADVTGKVGGLRFLDVSDEFRGGLHSWLRGNRALADPEGQHAPPAATSMDRAEQPTREPFKEPLKPATEGQSKTLRVAAMRLAAESPAPARKHEPEPRKPQDGPVLSYSVNEIVSREAQLPIPTIVELASEASQPRDSNPLRAAGAMFVVMLLVLLFLFRQGAGDGLIWLGKKIAGAPSALPIQQSDGQIQRPGPMADNSKADTHKEQEGGVAKKSDLPPSSTTVPEHLVASAQTSPPSAAADSLSSTPGAVKQAKGQGGSHPRAIRPQVVTEDKADSVRSLWAEVARGETSAEIALADMYVRGDKVPKNCAQARVLLGAAAKRGNEIAVRKLIDLDSQGGGCSRSAPQ